MPRTSFEEFLVAGQLGGLYPSIFYGSTEWVNQNCVFGPAQINLPILWGKAATLTMRSRNHGTVKIGGKMAVDT